MIKAHTGSAINQIPPCSSAIATSGRLIPAPKDLASFDDHVCNYRSLWMRKNGLLVHDGLLPDISHNELNDDWFGR
jgi:hypothetical protein